MSEQSWNAAWGASWGYAWGGGNIPGFGANAMYPFPWRRRRRL